MKTHTKNLKKKLALYSLLALVLLLALPVVHAQEDIIPESSEIVAAADTEDPSDIEGVETTSGNGMVKLDWLTATDNEEVTGYNVYYSTSPVVEDGDEYEVGPVDAGNEISYVVQELINETTYYFAVTAYDAAGNESLNYSVEISATPSEAAVDSEAPKVTSASTVDKFSVSVMFSEAVNLPPEAHTAFSILEDGTGTPLEVLSASMDLTDVSNKTVILVTSTQKADTNYILTAGIQITDLEENPIESGTSDTALFVGTDLEGAAEEAGSDLVASADDNVGPELIDIETSNVTTVIVTFSEPVELAADPVQNFVITEESDSNNTLTVESVSLSSDGTKATLVTADQQGINYFLIALDISDVNGNLMDVANNAAAFTGFVSAPGDTGTPSDEETVNPPADDNIAPEDVTNFVAKTLANMAVQLTWGSSLNTAGDLVNYILYKSTDGTIFSEAVKLDADAASHQLSGLIAGKKYYYKLSAQDGGGNESDGVVTSFVLPETGPELAFLFAGSLGLGRFFTRRKKKGLRK